MNRNAAFCGVMRWSASGSRIGALVMGGHLLLAGSGAPHASDHHGERPSPGFGDSRQWRGLATLRGTSRVLTRTAQPHPGDPSSLACRATMQTGAASRTATPVPMLAGLA